MLTQDRLKEVLDYNPETDRPGVGAMIGDQAGSLRKDGYIRISIDDHRYYAHPVAWLYVTGKFPKKFLDHKNMVRSDNRFDNLREATGSQNQANSYVRKNNKCGLKGASFHKGRHLWVAKINKGGKRHELGYFSTKEAAHEAYIAASLKLYGEFAKIGG